MNPRNYWYIEIVVLVVMLLLYGQATVGRNVVWKDELSLWSDVVRKSPNKARVYNAIGMYYYERRVHDMAIPYFQKSLTLNPNCGKAHNNLGLCFLGKGWINPAIEEFKQAIKTNPFDEMYHINLGIAYWERGLYEAAIKEIKIGKELRKKYKARCNQNKRRVA